jgi:hypothetical protein
VFGGSGRAALLAPIRQFEVMGRIDRHQLVAHRAAEDAPQRIHAVTDGAGRGPRCHQLVNAFERLPDEQEEAEAELRRLVDTDRGAAPIRQ